MAVACAASGGVVRFPTAGLVWGFRKTPRVRDVHVTIADGHSCRPAARGDPHPPLVRDPGDRRRGRDDGIAVTSPPRTAFDAAWDLGRDDLESLIEQGIQRQMFTIPTMWAVARRFASTAGPEAPASARC